MKKRMITVIALVILTMSIVTLLSACNTDKTEAEASDAVDTTDTAASSDVSDKKIEKIYVVCPEKATDGISRLVKNTSNSITEKTGIATEIVIDSITPYEAKEGCYYVVLGDTSYEQSKKISQSAEDKKMYYAATEDSVAVYAKTEQLLFIAAEQLFASLIVFLAVPEHQYKILRFILASSTNAAKGRKENSGGSVDWPLGANCKHSFL